MHEYSIRNIGELIEVINTIRRDHFEGEHPWFRGQSNPSWPLVPGVYRDNLAQNEVDLSLAFKSKARTRSNSLCPSDDDYISWLYLMQHFGVPTRILDWSESPIVAMYFALNSQRKVHRELFLQGKTGDEYHNSLRNHPDSSDARIWALWPTGLAHIQAGENEKRDGLVGVRASGNSDIQVLANAAFSKTVSGMETILPVLPNETDMRQFVQQATFTIHGLNTPLEQIDGADEALVAINIDNKELPLLGLAMEVLSVKQSTLFPDLENLAQEVREIHWLN